MQRQLAVPIHLAFSYDEEIGCLGVRPMIAEFGGRLVKPRDGAGRRADHR